MFSDLHTSIFQTHKGRYDSRCVQFILHRDYHLKVIRRYISLLLQSQGLYPHGARRKFRRQQQENPIIKKNKVNQNFKVKAKNEVWFGDITFIRTAKEIIYLSSNLDACPYRIVGYRIDTHMRDELVIECLIEALRKENPRSNLMIHVDRGSQYTGHRFFEVVQAHKLIHTHFRKGNPYDNPLMESFYKTLKREVLEKYVFKSKVEAIMIYNDYCGLSRKLL